MDSLAARVGLILALGLLIGCGGAADELGHATTAYEEARYEEAQTWLTDLEPNAGSMSEKQLARFYFLRGMTALRLEDRTDALYYLSLARELTRSAQTHLGPEWANVLTRSLEELDPNLVGSPAGAGSADEASPTGS